MTAFGRLWRRAPLWRTSLFIMVGGMGMAAFFPTPALKKHLPWLPGKAPGASPAPTQSAQGDGGGTSSNSPDSVTAPDPAIIQQGGLHLAGRIIPLPVGEWHPILAARTGPHGEISQQVLARTSLGVVSGVIVVEASQQPLPPQAVDDLERPCHDDRNYASQIVEKQGLVEECAYIGNAFILPGSPNGGPFVSAAFDRMNTLGFPIPPLMITLGWYHAAAQGTQGVQIEAVETLIAPIEPGSRQLLAPPPVWTKDGIKTNPAAAKFISDVKTWMPGWTDLLRRGFDGKLDANAIPIAPTRDPSAPKTP
ncbi:hypothetical protein GLF_2075 [Gluconobacter frateurii NBRC 101659]|uniref:hypothetical protein n=1 Tax=Gluconobacter japonicus TaxID=376620 RepID=UPI00029A006F|nr:hypothetical protein GLF_2075 [Gluconobacter frateurii NBRC 101659]